MTTTYKESKHNQIVAQMAIRMRTEGRLTVRRVCKLYKIGNNLAPLLIMRAEGLHQRWMLSKFAPPPAVDLKAVA